MGSICLQSAPPEPHQQLVTSSPTNNEVPILSTSKIKSNNQPAKPTLDQ